MTNRFLASFEAPPSSAKARRALLACGLWVRAAFVGASATAIAMIQLFQGEWSAMFAISTIVAGVALTVFSYRRSQAALGDAAKPVIVSATTLAAHR